MNNDLLLDQLTSVAIRVRSMEDAEVLARAIERIDALQSTIDHQEREIRALEVVVSEHSRCRR